MKIVKVEFPPDVSECRKLFFGVLENAKEQGTDVVFEALPNAAIIALAEIIADDARHQGRCEQQWIYATPDPTELKVGLLVNGDPYWFPYAF